MARRSDWRLRDAETFSLVFQKGRKLSGRFLNLRFMSADGEGLRQPKEPCFGIAVGKRLGPPVFRNRIRRIVREKIWTFWEEIPAGFYFVFEALSGIKVATPKAIRDELEELFLRWKKNKGVAVR